MKYLFCIFLCSTSLLFGQLVEKDKFGGYDIFGGRNNDIFQPRYSENTYDYLDYSFWNGYEARTNEEIIQLIKENPSCEALRLDYINNVKDSIVNITPLIGKLSNLKYLEIDGNVLVNYPKSLSKLKNLEELILVIRAKKEIEIDFSKLRNLKYLTIIWAEDLEVFPQSIFSLPKLVSLRLGSFSKFEDLALDQLPKLKSLRKIYFHRCNFKLPERGYHFTNLSSVHMRGSGFNIPEYFYECQTIKSLAVKSSNDTLDLCKVSNIFGLENLHITNKYVLGELHLPNLKNLYVQDVRDEKLDFAKYFCPNLESLHLILLPNVKTIDNIFSPRLKSLMISNNDSLEKVDIKNGAFPKLEEVRMWVNRKIINKPRRICDIVVKGYSYDY